MANIAQLLTEHIDIWTAADTEKKSGRGRVSSNAGSVYGVKKLRELILEAAVRGKLVPQNANDEPASELLQRIQAEKAKLIAEGKLKKEKLLAPISEDEKLFELPRGWEWVRLGQTGKVFNGNSINENKKLDKYTNIESGRPFIATKDVGYGREELNYENGLLIPFEDDTLKVALKGSVLICAEGGSAGKKVGITNKDICFGNKLFANEVWLGIEPYYIFHLYQSITFYSSFSAKMTGIIGGISLNEFLSIPIPLPSLNEQHRIVAKVDELMALCDQLEQQHSNAQEAHENLVRQLLATLTQSQNALQFNANWQRIYAHFDALFTTEASVDALKQTLLQLAVMGKLVPQDPNDEPASELLKRIQAEKAKLIIEGKLKKEKPIAPISENEKPFELPKSWEWVRPEQFSIKITDGEHFRPSTVDKGVYFLSAKDVRDEGVSLDDPLYITEEIAEKALQRCNPEYGDLLIVSRGATVGRMCKVNIPDKFCLLGSVILVKPTSLVLSDYLSISLKSPSSFTSLINASGSTAQPAIYLKDLKEIVLTLPPISEQHRIVTKVDTLMALCDQIKARIQQASQQQQAIADVLVAQAVV